MFTRILTIALVAFVAESLGARWGQLIVSWDKDQTTHFYVMPNTTVNAVNEGWTEISGVNPPENSTALGFQGDPTFILLFKNNSVSGCQFSVPKADVANSGQPFDYDNSPEIIEKYLNNEWWYTATMLFSYDESTDSRSLWFPNDDGFIEIPTKASQIPLRTKYLQKACVPTMGTHYYAVDPTTNCSTMSSFFVLTNNADVIGCGFQNFGPATKKGALTWWESISDSGISFVFGDSKPRCLSEAKQKYGIYSMHVWLTDENPKKLTC